MKHFVAFLVSVLLVACGGGDETPVAVIKASVPRPAANAATVSGGSGVAVHMYQALYGMAPSNEMLLNSTAQATADPSTFARNLTNNFANTSSTALAKLVLDNLGVTAATVTAVNGQGQSEYAILLDALGQMFEFYGTDARGQIILNATNLLAGLEGDGTYGATAISYNNQATANYSYSSNSANTVAAAISTATANAGAAQSVAVGAVVALDGSASKADLGRTLAYAWTLSRPAGSSTALSSATSAKPTFTADVAGTYVASLTVNDGKVNSTTVTVSITATLTDTSGPTVGTISVTPSTVDVTSASQVVTATVVVSDATGINLSSLPTPYWYNSTDIAGTRIDSPWVLTAGDAKQATFASTVTIPVGAKPGQWSVGSIAFKDTLGYSSTNGGYEQFFTVK